jgi:hypothetical protein
MIPLARPLHYGCKGRDVTAVQLALRVAKFRKTDPTGKYGVKTQKQVHEFKLHHGIHLEHGYREKTHHALWPYFGYTARHLYRQAYERIEENRMVNRIIGAAWYGYNEREWMHYTQDGRRGTDFGPPPNVPNWTDCSGFATWCYKSAGAPDPNGLGYRIIGYTGTMIQHGTVISTPTRACLVFYGHPVSHVAVYVGNGNVISFGSESGPLYLPLRYRSDFNHMRRYF